MINSYETPSRSKSVFTEVYTQKRGTCVTVVILGVIIGIFCFAYITFGNESIADLQKSSSTLRLVNILVHHGQTSPKFTFPSDLYRNETRWQIGLGELSKRGKQNMFSLGKFFRERYTGYLPDLYFSSDIEVLSSNADTCLMSAAVLLAGLYPPHKFQIWNPHILWQPIPVRGIPAELDKMIDVTRSCPALIQTRKLIENNIADKDKNLLKLYDFLTEHTEMEVRNLSTVLALYNLFNAQEKNSLLLPDWLEVIYPKNLLKYATKALTIETETIDITKLSIGPLLEKITSDIIKKRENAIRSKMFLYSVHEKSIVNMLRILNRDASTVQDLKPEFSSCVIIELHHIDNDTVVQVYHLEKVGKQPSPINITQCGNPCFYDDFVKFTKTMIPNNWDDACTI